LGKQQRTDSRDFSVRRERAVLVGVELRDTKYDARESLQELADLADSAGAIVVDQMLQKRDRLDATYFIGKGKVEELARRVRMHEADVIIFDDDLSPGQLREIEAVCECKVIDRSELILDIFASRARTHEARLQVELAQLEYTAPRLRGMWTHLERIAGAGGGTGAGSVGGIGTRGPGERQIEIDRRLVDRRVTQLKRQIAEIHHRKIRQVRARHEHFNVSLVGYTNAGKSTLMNTLTGANVFVADRLFATLDTKTQRWNLGESAYALLSDTVGFVRRLPHHLVASFRATLEETVHADLLLHVVDASSPTAWQQYQSVQRVLEDLGVRPSETERSRDGRLHRMIVLLNKIDALRDEAVYAVLRHQLPDAIPISARTGAGLDRLVDAVYRMVAGDPREVVLRLPAGDGRAVHAVEKQAEVADRRYLDGHVEMRVTLGGWVLERLIEQFPAIQVVE
jgi:GTP-binding protein HflX